MVKQKSILVQDDTAFNTAIGIDEEIALIGDIVGFDISIRQNATFGAGASSMGDILDYFKLITDGSKTLHEMNNFGDDAMMGVLSMLSGIANPTNEDMVTTVEKQLHFFLPFPVMRALFSTVKLKGNLKAGTTVNANITALDTYARISVRHGFIEDMVVISDYADATATTKYKIPLPNDKGNLTGFFICSTDADLIHKDTYINLLDESGLPMIDNIYAQEIVAQNEQMLTYGWKGLYKGVYILYVDCPEIACKPDIKINLNAGSTLTGGIQVYYLNSLAEQYITRPDMVSPKMIEVGAIHPEAISITRYDSLPEQIARQSVSLFQTTGDEVSDVEMGQR